MGVYLFRKWSKDQGTFGSILVRPMFRCCSLELPWRGNKPNVSCIPKGVYSCKIRKSPRFSSVYWVTEVEGRSWILIHSGNFAGDIEKGFKSHVAGCILLGKYFGVLGGQRAVLLSRPTVRRFGAALNWDDFNLHIMGRVG